MFRLKVCGSFLVCVSIIGHPCVSAQQSSSAGIVGRWRSSETSKGGIGAMYEFLADGTADFSPGVVVEMTWRIEKDQLLFPPSGAGEPEEKRTLKWLGDNKVSLVTGGNPGGAELTRASNRVDASNLILGEWIENREMAGRTLQAHWFFYPGGKGLLLMPFVIQHGHYTITGSVLHFEIPNNTSVDYKFELNDNALTLFKPEGGEYRYARY
jgi:hypothetical protein